MVRGIWAAFGGEGDLIGGCGRWICYGSVVMMDDCNRLLIDGGWVLDPSWGSSKGMSFCSRMGKSSETMKNQLNLFSRKKINKTPKRSRALNHFAQITKQKIPDVRGKVRNQGYLISEKLNLITECCPCHINRDSYTKKAVPHGGNVKIHRRNQAH